MKRGREQKTGGMIRLPDLEPKLCPVTPNSSYSAVQHEPGSVFSSGGGHVKTTHLAQKSYQPVEQLLAILESIICIPVWVNFPDAGAIYG